MAEQRWLGRGAGGDRARRPEVTLSPSLRSKVNSAEGRRMTEMRSPSIVHRLSSKGGQICDSLYSIYRGLLGWALVRARLGRCLGRAAQPEPDGDAAGQAQAAPN